MRSLVLFFTVFIIQQVDSTTFTCDINSPCGCSTSSAVVARIVGGEIVVQQSWSWAVSIRDAKGHFCGGSIVSPDYVITAAHCLQDANINEITILAGSLNLNPTLSDSPQIRSVARSYIHPNFNNALLTNDVALLRLIRSFNMTNTNIKPICLPSGSNPEPPDNTDLIAVGWGTTASNVNVASPVLRQVTLQSINIGNNYCQTVVADINKQFCAGVLAGGKDTCQGDSGGPLMAFVNSVWQLDGLTSFGWKCAVANIPAVYTRVSYYTDWIQSILADDGTGITTMSTSSTTRKTAAANQNMGSRSSQTISLIVHISALIFTFFTI